MLIIKNNIKKKIRFIDDESGRRIDIPIAMIELSDGDMLYSGYLI